MCMNLVRESGDISCEVSIRWKLTDMIHQVLHHLEMTLEGGGGGGGGGARER